ncbi:MAG TPA: metal-dependent phosphohydrolase, partial [Cyanobacteria bacterium UBA9273]|nr:metal-dependent phosphohydrolase [Cyanobacteria bacterium UBA9273]
SDALYHNVEHTILVTLVGQEILRGKHIRDGGVSCEDWLHFIISLLCHDIGYVKGVC